MRKRVAFLGLIVSLSASPAMLLRCGGEPGPVTPTKPVAAPNGSAGDASASASASTSPTALSRWGYPVTLSHDVAETIHGVTVHDRFRWLEDAKDAKVQAWVKSEDAFARDRLAKLPDHDAIRARLTELFYVDSQGAPSKARNRYFWSHRDAKQEKSVVFWREGKTGKPKVLLDPNTWSEDGSVSLGSWDESQDGKYIAYGKKEHNSDEATLYVMEVATHKVSTVDVIPGAKYAAPSWVPPGTKSGDGFYYTWLPEVDGKTVTVADRPGHAEVRFHKLGEDPQKDRLVHAATGDSKTFLGANVSRDGHFLFCYIEHGWRASDVYFKDLRSGKEPADFTPLVVGQPYKYGVFAYHDRFYIETDDGAPNHHVFRADPAKPDRASWQEIIPERKDAALDQINLAGGKLALSYLKDVVSHLEIHDLDGKLVREIALPAKGAASALIGEPDEDEAYYTFTSFTFPTEIYETSVRKGGSKLYFKLNVPVDPSKYAVEQEFATSKDGTRIPYFVVGPKTFDKTKGAPALVYGYGGFLGTQRPRFTSSAYPWLERGGVYVVANLRGGGEYGEKWHQAGMLHEKQNVFDDLRAVLDKLIKDGVSSPDRIAVRGASNGGLLVAAAITQFPELFRVGLCGVPLVDMLRYHLFGSGKTWEEEYGSADNVADFKAIYAYSPYQHVTRGTKYPAVLLLSADSDDRVDPMHARKFTAELQSDSTGGIVLLRVEKNAGHGGADLIKSAVDSVADELAFALDEIHSGAAATAPSTTPSVADGGLTR